MKLKRLAPIFLMIFVFVFSAMPAMAFDPNQLVFGDNTNVRPAPTSGTLTGTYRTAQDWVQTGPIDCYHCLLYFGGNATFAYSVTSHPEVPGGNAGAYCTTQNGTGYGGYGSYGTTGGGGGAGFGGAGGVGGYESSVPNGFGVGGRTYPAEFSLNGSGGGAGTQYSTISGGSGGLGGDGIYIECAKAVTINAAITCNGGVGGASGSGNYGGESAGAGGGGSGGNFDCRALGGITIGSSGSISCNGGIGGTSGDPDGFSGGGGGGGYVNLEPGPGNTTVNNGSVTANGGTYGSGASGTQIGVAGSPGVINLNNTFRGARFAF